MTDELFRVVAAAVDLPGDAAGVEMALFGV